jgi:sugar phosphate isomerase/epimerase
MPLPLGVQLHTFADPGRFGGTGHGLDVPTLEAIAEAGFLGVETVGVPGGDVVMARRALGALDLAVTSSHTWADVGEPDAFARAAEDIAELGSPRIVITPEAPATADALAALTDRISAVAEIASEHGLRLTYHNHSGEMAPIDGTPVIDRLAASGGDALDFQIDIFWAVVGRTDPAKLIGRLGSRVVSLHLKDGIDLPAAAGGDESFINVPVGAGIVDPEPAILAAEAAGSLEWLIVEFDHVVGPPIDGVRASLENLVARGLARSRHR